MHNKPRIQELLQYRKEFPLVPYEIYHAVVSEFREYPELVREALHEAQRPYMQDRQRYLESVQDLQKRLRVGEYHTHLSIPLPDWVDTEHAQAIIMYAFLMPGSRISFVGGRSVPVNLIRDNVANKLRGRFNPHRYAEAYRFLKQQGVFIEQSGAQGRAASLTPHENDPHVGPDGREILIRTKQFAAL